MRENGVDTEWDRLLQCAKCTNQIELHFFNFTSSAMTFSFVL